MSLLQVRVPRVYWQLTTPTVITLEYLPGTKINAAVSLTAAGLDTKLLARRATECYLIQILKHGFLHSDPHPGVTHFMTSDWPQSSNYLVHKFQIQLICRA